MSDRPIGRPVPDESSEGDPPAAADDAPSPGSDAATGTHSAPLAQRGLAPQADGITPDPQAEGTARGDRADGQPADPRADGTGAEPRADGMSAGPGAGGPGAGAGGDQPGSNGKNSTGEARRRGRRRRPLWRELPVLIVIALVIALIIKTFVIQAFFIPSASMENTLEIGDKVLVNKLIYHFRSIQPGDIVVFDGTGSWDPVSPASRSNSDPLERAYDVTIGWLVHSIAGLFGTAPGQTDYIKRVIGVPGDRVVCCNAQGLITVNGVALHEQSYLYPGATSGSAPEGYSGHFSITVPPGRLWVLGDNRAISADSRLHQDDPGRGTIPENQVIGRAFMIIWPLSRWRILPIPSTFSQPGIAARAAAALPSGAVQVEPAAPFLPLGAGLAGAVPLTWLQRAARRRGRGHARHVAS
jgi:signal peptidase I